MNEQKTIPAAAQQNPGFACLLGMKIRNCLAACALLLASCNAPRYVYSPSATNTAMSAGAGDGAVSAYGSVSGNGVGINLMGNYALSKFFGVGAQFYYTGDKTDGSDGYIGGTPPQIDINYTRQMALVQAYFYMPFNKSETLFGELSAGYGTGRYDLKDVQRPSSSPPQTYTHNAKAGHTAVHGALYGVMGKERNIRLGGSLRFNSVRYHDISTSYNPTQLSAYHLDSLTYKNINFLEPALTFRYIVGAVPNLEINAQVGLSAKLGGPLIDYRNQHFSLGVGYAFGRKRTK